MKVIMIRRFGDPSVLVAEEIPAPVPRDGEVLIRVHAAGTNPVDAGNRADGTWAGIELPWVPGYELAGVIERVAADVTNLVPGQRVAAVTAFRPGGGGAYAEFAAVRADRVAPLADSVSFIAAAAASLAGGTAWEVLERLRLAEGGTLLVLGASGGVGSFLLQLARLRGITTIAVGRREHHERMHRLGASTCIDYTEADPCQAGSASPRGDDPPAPPALRRVDAIADLVGGKVAACWLPRIREYGQIASIADPELDLGLVIDANITFHGVLWSGSGDQVRTLAGLLADGSIIAHVPHVLPLAEAAQAHRLLEGRHPGGKIVLTVG